jgi:hypothetical protein
MNIGDNVYYDFELCKIIRIEDNKITEVSDGYISSNGNLSDECFPDTPRIKEISNMFYVFYENIQKNDKSINLNYPDIHWRMVELWIKACSSKFDSLCNEYVSHGKQFSNCIIKECSHLKDKEVFGIRLLR